MFFKTKSRWLDEIQMPLVFVATCRYGGNVKIYQIYSSHYSRHAISVTAFYFRYGIICCKLQLKCTNILVNNYDFFWISSLE